MEIKLKWVTLYIVLNTLFLTINEQMYLINNLKRRIFKKVKITHNLPLGYKTLLCVIP